jgi:FKBP-type peptidyl-prolyl cis-trans isomerase
MTQIDTQLKIEDITIGTGSEVKSGDNILIHYLGTLENGQKFDSSYDRKEPFEVQIGVGYVIKGWDQGVVGMKVGGKRKLTIPPELGYGSREIPGVIPANSTLIFEVELIEIFND